MNADQPFNDQYLTNGSILTVHRLSTTDFISKLGYKIRSPSNSFTVFFKEN